MQGMQRFVSVVAAVLVVFVSNATDLVAGDTNNWQDAFVRDVTAGVTTRVSVSSLGVQANNRSVRPCVSHDGMKVVFSSSADNLVPNDGNGKADIFLHDRANATTIRVSVNDAGWGGNGTSGDPEISGDGTKVVFDSLANNLVAADGNSRQDVFLRDLVAARTTRISVDDLGNEGNGHSYEASISEDGSVVAFVSEASNLVPEDFNGVADVFARYRDLSRTRRLSVSNLGAEADAACRVPQISADAQVVSFESASAALDPNDLNGFVDVFAHATCEVVFTEFGVGFPGTGGLVPRLYGEGGSGFHGASVHIRDGMGFAHGFLWLGLGTADLPFYGGRFYIDPSQFFIPLPVLLDGVVGQPGEGALDLDGGDLTSAAGLTIYLQLTLIDPAAAFGVSLSNGLEMEFAGR